MSPRQKNSNGDNQRPNNEVEEYDDDELAPPLPPDGGWGWLVVAASFLNNLIVDGVGYSFGIIMPELLDYYETTNSKAALVGSMVTAMYLIVGPIVSALANRFGCRIVAIIGSIISGIFFVVSQWSSSIEVMMVTYGVMGGIGFGMMYLPSIVMVGFYFDKKRAMATGIAVCGSGIGTFVFAPLASWLVSTYTWRGANVIIGAIIFHGIACAMIYLPLEPTRRRPKQNSDSVTFQTSPTGTSTYGAGTSTTAEDGGTVSKPSNKQIDSVKYGASSNSLTRAGTTSASGSQRSLTGSQKQQVANPFARQDVLYTGSVTSLHEYKQSPDMKTYVQSYTDLPTAVDEKDGCCNSAKNIFLKMFDFSLLMSPSFLVVCLSGIFVFAGLQTPFVYVYKKAVDLGTPKSTASIIISLIGIFNTAGRLASGWLADRPWADSLVIHNVAAILAGLGTCFVPLLNSFGLLVAYACWFGTFIAAFIALRSIVIVDLIGIKKLNNAFGITSLFQGVAYLFGSPMSGAILESTGSYVGPFVVSGLLIAAGGIVCLPARRIAAWELARSEKRQYGPVKKNETA